MGKTLGTVLIAGGVAYVLYALHTGKNPASEVPEGDLLAANTPIREPTPEELQALREEQQILQEEKRFNDALFSALGLPDLQQAERDAARSAEFAVEDVQRKAGRQSRRPELYVEALQSRDDALLNLKAIRYLRLQGLQ